MIAYTIALLSAVLATLLGRATLGESCILSDFSSYRNFVLACTYFIQCHATDERSNCCGYSAYLKLNRWLTLVGHDDEDVPCSIGASLGLYVFRHLFILVSLTTDEMENTLRLFGQLLAWSKDGIGLYLHLGRYGLTWYVGRLLILYHSDTSLTFEHGAIQFYRNHIRRSIWWGIEPNAAPLA